MSDLNVVTLTGRLTDDAKKSVVNENVTKVDFTLCVNSFFNKSNYANYFYLSYFGDKAENIFPYLKKGTCVNVEAKLKQDRWEKNGETHQKISIVTRNVDFQSAGTSKKTGFEAIDSSLDFPPAETFEIPEN